MTKNISMIQVEEDLVDIIWTDPGRSSIPNNPLIVHPIEFTGICWRCVAMSDPAETQVVRNLTDVVIRSAFVLQRCYINSQLLLLLKGISTTAALRCASLRCAALR